MTKSSLTKVGTLKGPNGKYEKDGIEKTRYNEIGVVFASPHYSRMAIKLHSNGFGEGQWASIFYDEDKVPKGIESSATDNRNNTNIDF